VSSDDVSIKEFIETLVKELRLQTDQRFDASDRAVLAALATVKESGAAALAATEKAVNKAEAANDKRMDTMNEFRGQMADQAATFVSKSEVDLRFTSMGEKIEPLMHLGILIVELQAQMRAMTEKVDGIDKSVTLNTGRLAGSDRLRNSAYAAVATIATLVGLFFALTNR
jgi:hypothetical protein